MKGRIGFFLFFVALIGVATYVSSCAHSGYEDHLQTVSRKASKDMVGVSADQRMIVVKNLISNVNSENDNELSETDLLSQSTYIVTLEMIGSRAPTSDDCASLKANIRNRFTSKENEEDIPKATETALSVLNSLCQR